MRDNNPVLVFEHKLLYGSKGREAVGNIDLTAEVPEEEYLVPMGKAVTKRAGSDVTIVATHVSLYRALAAAQLLSAEGVECEVIDPLTLFPMDFESIFASVSRTGRLVIAHEDTLSGGWGAELAARVAEHRIEYLETGIRRVATADVPVPYSPVMENAIVPSVERIAGAVRQALG